MLTPTQRRRMQEGLSEANRSLLDIERLERLAEVSPGHAPAVQELRDKREFLHKLADTALQIDREATNG